MMFFVIITHNDKRELAICHTLKNYVQNHLRSV
ncbi:hypothetical protein EPYR_02790 [Erwinia pyrifoliae DSM 12163]|nr:hypothetical protein EPYR_02790 [Erwinia pyrifoliae DSM 12163]